MSHNSRNQYNSNRTYYHALAELWSKLRSTDDTFGGQESYCHTIAETNAIAIEPVAKAQAELWSKLWSTDDTLVVEARELLSHNSRNQCNSNRICCKRRG